MPAEERKSPRAKWKVDTSATRSRIGPSTPSGITRPWGALPVGAKAGLPLLGGSAAAVGPGHAYLQMVGLLPTGISSNYIAGYSKNDGNISFKAYTRRSWAHSGFAPRRPRALVISGAATASFTTALLGADLSDFEDAGIDILGAGATNGTLCPLLGLVPLTAATATSIGGLGYLSMTARAATGYTGGEVYFASLGQERMAFGDFTDYTHSGLFSGDPTIGTSYHPGYTFVVMTLWGTSLAAGFHDDPGEQSFTGCTEVGSTLDDSDPGLSGRIQMFLNESRAAEDMAVLAAYAANFDRLRVAFWGNEEVASFSGGDLFGSLDPDQRNPGTPATVASTIDGGNGLVTYHANPSSDGVFIGSNTAAAILTDARSFFGL